MGKLLTVRQVAELVQVSEKTVRRAIRDGRLASRRVGGRGGARRGVRVTEEAVIAWTDAGKGETEEKGVAT